MKCLLLCVGLAAQAASAASPADYANVIPIETRGQGAAWQFELSDSVYAGSVDPDLRDLAVFNASGRAVPMTIRPVELPDSQIEQRAPVPMLALPSGRRGGDESDLRLIVERDASGRLRRLETQSSAAPSVDGEPREWLLDLGAFDRGTDTLELDWDAPRNRIIARFEVSASNDLQRWDLLNEDATVVMVEQGGARIERRSIDFSTTRLRYIRLRRTDDGVPLSGMRAEAARIRHVASSARVQWLQAASVDRIGDLEASPTRHLYVLSSAVPATDVKINLSSDNAVAQMDVLASADATPAAGRWIRRARLVAFRLLQGGAVIDSGFASLSPGPRIRTLRLDSATPLASPPDLVVGYRPARLLFLAEGQGPFLLAVGSARERYPDYPIEPALESLRARFGGDWQPATAELGDSRASAGAEALRPAQPPVHWRNWLLWSVLVGAAAIVGGIAISLLRGAGQPGAEKREQPPEE